MGASRPQRLLQCCLALAASSLLSACAGWPGEAASTPSAQLVSIRQLGRDGGETHYLVTVRIANPGPRTLQVSGMTCRLRVDETLVAEGFTGALAPLAPGSATQVGIETKANLFGGLKLMAGPVAPGPRQYRVEVRLRRPWHWMPIVLHDSGEVDIDK